MRSPEKTLAFLEQLQGYTDDEMAEVLPVVPPPVLRSALAMAAAQVPEDHVELDGYLAHLGELAESLRSDVIVIAS